MWELFSAKLASKGIDIYRQAFLWAFPVSGAGFSSSWGFGLGGGFGGWPGAIDFK